MDPLATTVARQQLYKMQLPALRTHAKRLGITNTKGTKAQIITRILALQGNVPTRYRSGSDLSEGVVPVRDLRPNADNVEEIAAVANMLQGQTPTSAVRRSTKTVPPALSATLIESLIGRSDFKLNSYKLVINMDGTFEREPEGASSQLYSYFDNDRCFSNISAFMENQALRTMGVNVSLKKVPADETEPYVHENALVIVKNADGTATFWHFEPHMDKSEYLKRDSINYRRVRTTIAELLMPLRIYASEEDMCPVDKSAQGGDSMCQTWSMWYVSCRARGMTNAETLDYIDSSGFFGLLEFMREILTFGGPGRRPTETFEEYMSHKNVPHLSNFTHTIPLDRATQDAYKKSAGHPWAAYTSFGDLQIEKRK